MRFTRTNTPLLWPTIGLIICILTGQWMGLLGIDPQRTVAHTHHGQRLSFLGRIEELPTQRTPGARWLRAETSLFCYRTEPEDGRWTAMPGDAERIWLYIDTTRQASPQEVDPQRLDVGDIVEFRGRIYSSLEGDSTGYNRYMLRTRGVTGRCYTWRVERVEQDSTRFTARVARFRDRLNSRLKTDNEQTTSIIQALAIGRQQAVDQELRRSYSRTGLAHLLSVSGLHVGIVFAILNLLLGWMRLWRWGNVAVGCAVIALLGGYAVLTGLAPAVVRAVVMFSLFQVGLMLSRYTNPLNTLCAAAIGLLLWNPNYIYHIGFQLSFAAMAGIIVLQRPIGMLWRPKWVILKWLWSLTSVTLAAQVGVFPLVMYHFGMVQLAGVLLSPLVWFSTPVIIGGALFYLACGWEWVLEMTHCVTGWQNGLIEWLAGYPWIAVEGIQLSTWGCAGLYGLIISGMVWVNRRAAP